MRRTTDRLAPGVAVLVATTALVSGLAACSGSSGSGSRASSSAPVSSAARTSPTPTPSPTTTAFTTTCETALPVNAVDQAAGLPVIGSTSFVVGVAEPDIGRLAYLNCRYGLPDAVPGQPDPVPQVEIGVSLYDSVDQAGKRADGTVEDYREHGATPVAAKVGSQPATVLTGYGFPTLVVVQGVRTVAVSATADLVTSNDVLVKLAASP